MVERSTSHFSKIFLFAALMTMLFGGCARDLQLLEKSSEGQAANLYLIGPGDVLDVFIWGNDELSVSVPVRPDGRITTPLVEDVVASGKTPSQLAREMEKKLNRYIKKPVVTITVTQFVGRATEQIRVVGQVRNPQTIPFRENLTLLDVVIAAGGLNEFAAGNNSTVARRVDGKLVHYRVRLDDLANAGDMSANAYVQPGDVVFIPESWF